MAATTAAVVGAVAAVGSTVSARKSAKEASKQQERAAREGLALTQGQFGEVQQALSPFIEGVTAEQLFPSETADADRARLAELQQQRSQLLPSLSGGFGLGRGRPFDPSAFQQLAAINAEIQDIESRATEPLTGPQRAFGLQQAFAGALGPEAQEQAFQGFRESPGVAFLREQGLRQIESGAAARGGLGGGERLRELTRFSQGLALQDFANQFNRLGVVSGTGLSAAQALGGVSGQAGVTQANLINRAGAAQALGTLGAQQATSQGVEQLVAQLPAIVSAFDQPSNKPSNTGGAV